jgi:hypothetical protein
MISTYSIEKSADSIHNLKTKEYFGEVLSSYAVGNNRAAVAGLWTVVVCDLLFKLQELRDIYNDPKAIALLQEVEQKQSQNPNSPQWEEFLLDQVKVRTLLIDPSEYSSLKHLHDQRHLSSHPIITNHTTELSTPSTETVRALIRASLDGILCKPPILSNNILESIVVDIASNKVMLPGASKLEAYLAAKYYNNLAPPVAAALFKQMWKFVFRLDNLEATANRSENYIAISLLVKMFRNEIENHFMAEPQYYSSINPDPVILFWLCRFFSTFPNLYAHTDAALKSPLLTHVGANDDSEVVAWFLAINMHAHLQRLLAKAQIESSFSPSAEVMMLLIKQCDEPALIQAFNLLCVKIYGSSRSFREADSRYNTYIRSLLPSFDVNTLSSLVEAIENERQTWDRSMAVTDHLAIVERMEELNPSFDFSRYPRFFKPFDRSTPDTTADPLF